ncbi:MAG: hypothetical protein Q4G68_01930 [Planctomycetia bacterium]|nr:hypothetical protein [Planctomycetia bacterium]
MQIRIELGGEKKSVKREEVFRLAQQGKISPATKLWIDDRETVCGKIRGLTFPGTDPEAGDAKQAVGQNASDRTGDLGIFDLESQPVATIRPIPKYGPDRNYASSGVFAATVPVSGSTATKTVKPATGKPATAVTQNRGTNFLDCQFQYVTTPALVKIFWFCGLFLPPLIVACWFCDLQSRKSHEERLALAQQKMEENAQTLQRLNAKLFQPDLTEKEIYEGTAAVARAEKNLELSTELVTKTESEFVLTFLDNSVGRTCLVLLAVVLYVMALRLLLEHIVLTARIKSGK